MAIDKKIPEARDLSASTVIYNNSMSARCADSPEAHSALGCPPIANRGGKVKSPCNAISGVTRYTQMVLNNKGRLVEIPLRKGNKNAAFIDQITFTIDEESLRERSIIKFVSDNELAESASMLLYDIFGFGLWRKAEHSGGRFYEQCWLIGNENANYGRVHFGGQRDTILFELTGTGCNAANDNWESRLYTFLNFCVRSKITRVDLAHDFLEGEYSPTQAYDDWQNNLYTSAYRKPLCEKVGTDWETDMGKGKTLYIGSRQSSRFVRIYEKGKAYGDKTSSWTRAEIELKGKDIIIPFDVLLKPGEYFSGSYPVFESISNTPERVHSVSKKLEMTLDKVVFYAKQQCGRAINAIQQRYIDIPDSEIIEMLRDQDNKVPSRLAVENFSASFANLKYLHDETESPDLFWFTKGYQVLNPI